MPRKIILKNVLCILCSSEMSFFFFNLNAGNFKNLGVSQWNSYICNPDL